MSSIGKDPRVDVIIALSRPDTLFYNCIKRILKQTVEVGRIIVVCPDGDCDGIERISDKMEIHAYLGEDRAVTAMKNYGAAFSDADMIVFISPESKAYDKYLLERLIKPLTADRNISASFARSMARGDCNESERYELIYYYPRGSFILSPTDKETGRKLSPLGYDCSAYIKSSFDSADGYDRAYSCEDDLLALELLDKGESIAYCGNAVVISSKDLSPIKQFKRYFDIGVFRKDALSRYGYGLEVKDEARLGLKGELYLLDYKEYLWMGYDVIYKIAKYLGYIRDKPQGSAPKA